MDAPTSPPSDATPQALAAARRTARVYGFLAVLLFVTLLGVVLVTFRDYGITTDEGVQHRHGRRIVRWRPGAAWTSFASDP